MNIIKTLMITEFIVLCLIYTYITLLNILILKNEKPEKFNNTNLFDKLISMYSYEVLGKLEWEINGQNIYLKKRVNNLYKIIKVILILLIFTFTISIII